MKTPDKKPAETRDSSQYLFALVRTMISAGTYSDLAYQYHR